MSFLFIFGCARSLLLCGLFSSCSKWGPLFAEVPGLLIAGASHCDGFSCCRARLWGARASVVAVPGFRAQAQ